MLPTASIGKLFLLLRPCSTRSSTVGSTPTNCWTSIGGDHVADSGLLQHLDGRALSVIDLCRFVGAVSDNLATNVLIRRVGLDRVGRDDAPARDRSVRPARHRPRRPRAVHPPFLSTGAAGELERLMRGPAGETCLEVSRRLVELLRLNTDLSMVAAAFALDPLAHVGDDLGIRLFNKTGRRSAPAPTSAVSTAASGPRPTP